MRIRRWLALSLSVGTTAGLLGVAPTLTEAAASCVGPTLAIGSSAGPGQPTTPAARLTRGEPVQVVGAYFFTGCEDTATTGPGCHAAPPADPQSPQTGVRLALTQGGRSWSLGTADAADRSRQYSISWRVAVPTDVAPGEATLEAGTASLPVLVS